MRFYRTGLLNFEASSRIFRSSLIMNLAGYKPANKDAPGYLNILDIINCLILGSVITHPIPLHHPLPLRQKACMCGVQALATGNFSAKKGSTIPIKKHTLNSLQPKYVTSTRNIRKIHASQQGCCVQV